MFIVWLYVHNLFQFGAMVNCWMKWAFLLRNKYIAFCVFRTLWLVFHTLPPNTCSKLKGETLYWYANCGQRQQQKHQNYNMPYLSFNFKHIQQINLIFLLLTLKMYLSVGHRMKFVKQLKCTLNNKAVSLKHVYVTWASQHVLDNL